MEEVLSAEELFNAASKYLDYISDGPVCNDGSCIRCRLVSICIEAMEFTEARMGQI